MSNTDEEFFLENIVKVNKTVQTILLAANLVPFALCIGNLFKIWEIPFNYCLTMLGFEIVVSTITVILNKSNKFQTFSMYFGVIATSVFVAILAYNGLVRISISYAFGTVISFLYYNKKLTIVTCIVNYLISIYLSYVHSFTNFNVVYGLFTQVEFIIQMVIGYTIEFSFLLFISFAVSNRTKKTMSQLMRSLEQRDKVYDKLKKQNEYITKINSDLETTNKELYVTQYKIIHFVSQCLGSHDLFTGRHVIHTQKYVEIICKQLAKEGFYKDELTEDNINLFTQAAFLHDIGKIHIPEGILNKTGKFTTEEFEIMKCHPEEGRKLLEFLPLIEDGAFNIVASSMAYCHHEKWDGTGYPRGISGTDIPLCARIMAAADVLDALISQRLYKEPMSVEEAMDVFKNSSGTHFEPCIAQAVINCSHMIYLIDQDFKYNESESNAEELEWWQRYHKITGKKVE